MMRLLHFQQQTNRLLELKNPLKRSCYFEMITYMTETKKQKQHYQMEIGTYESLK